MQIATNFFKYRPVWGVSVACLLVLFGTVSLRAQSRPADLTPFERDSNQTATYAQIINWYGQLARQYPQAKLVEVGKTDVGKPLHLFLLAADQKFTARPDRVTLLLSAGH